MDHVFACFAKSASYRRSVSARKPEPEEFVEVPYWDTLLRELSSDKVVRCIGQGFRLTDSPAKSSGIPSRHEARAAGSSDRHSLDDGPLARAEDGWHVSGSNPLSSRLSRPSLKPAMTWPRSWLSWRA